jgi:acyl-CoA reductase-like NAD-dependent aldehyde dehydrogenase
MIVRENPTHPSEIVGEVATSDAAAVDQAVRAADAVQRDWAQLPLTERAERLRAALAPLEAETDRLATLLAREMGKPLPDCRGEIGFARMFGGFVADRAPEVVQDSEVDDAAGRMLLQHVPYGVVAAITPWNAPVILSMLKVAPALVTGNAIVVKPSPLAPLAVTDLYAQVAAGLPAGLLQVIHGDAEAGAALVGHELTRKVAFTGGGVTATAIGRTAAERITPTVMELGGNDPAVFLADAVIDDAAMARAVIATFATSGQVCMASKRLYVHASRFDEFVEAFTAAAADVLIVGDPLAEGVTMGPVINAAARDRLLGLRGESVAAGGVAVDLGTVPDPDLLDEGYFVRPALVTGLADDARLVAEEQFGPLVPIQVFDTEDEVVARANAGDLGLGASVWSADEDHAFAVAQRLEAGFRFINTHNRTGMALRAPFGGVKRSGFGREYGDEGLLEYVQTCVVNAPAAFRPGAEAPTSATAYPGT